MTAAGLSATAGADAGGSPAAPGQPAGRRPGRGQEPAYLRQPGSRSASPACSPSPMLAAAPSSTPTTTWPPARCGSWPSGQALALSPSSPGGRSPSWSAGTSRRWSRHRCSERVRVLAEALSADGYAASASGSPARRPAASSCASTTARWRMLLPSTPSYARRRPRHSAACSGLPCSASRRSRNGDGICTTHITAPSLVHNRTTNEAGGISA